MKNSLLAVMALCGATSSTLPLWAAEWENPIPNFVEPNLDTDGTGGGRVLYLPCGYPEVYNVRRL